MAPQGSRAASRRYFVLIPNLLTSVDKQEIWKENWYRQPFTTANRGLDSVLRSRRGDCRSVLLVQGFISPADAN